MMPKDKNIKTKTTQKNLEFISEKKLDIYLKKLVEKQGGVYLKVEPIHTRGIPDRFLLMPPGNLMLVELKTTGEIPSPIQKAFHRILKKIGFTVWIIDTKKGADDLINFYEVMIKQPNYEG